MRLRYLTGGLLLLAAPAAAQAPAPTSPAAAAPTPADSLAALPNDAPTVVRVADWPLLPVQERLRQVAGVQVTPYSGAPGSAAVVRVRGAGSVAFGHFAPLYVVDGVPMLNSQAPDPDNVLVLSPSSSSRPPSISPNPLLHLSAHTIESVEVLKGALATAHYGLYGQNGVVLIRTRQGTAAQPLRVHYRGLGLVSQPLGRFDLLNARQFAELANEAALYNNQPQPYTPAQVAGFGQGTDWQREVLRPAALGQEHQIGVEGGTARGTRYYAGGSYLGQAGVVREAFLRRYALRLNLTQTLGPRLRLEGRAGFGQTTERRPLIGLLPSALAAVPTVPVRDAAGNYPSTNPLSPADQLSNPALQLAETYRRPRERRLLAQAGVVYQPLPGLSAEWRTSLERADLTMDQFNIGYGGLNAPPAKRTSRYQSEFRQWIAYPAVRYAAQWRERHALTAALEGQYWWNNYDQKVTFDNGALGFGTTSYSYQLNQLNALLTAGYTYAGRYEVQLCLRADRSPGFFSNPGWAMQPGGQLTWHAAREAGLSGGRFSTLDVWAGWGRTGNASNADQYTPASTTALNQTTQAEAGVQIGLWQDALQLTANVYRRQTAGLLDVWLTLPFGDPTVIYVPHQIRNRGAELSVRGRWQRASWQGTSWLSAAYNDNRYTDEFPGLQPSGPQRAGSGQPGGAFFGYRYQPTVNPANGTLRYQDLDGNGQIQFEDQRVLGPGVPPWLLSLGQELHRGRWSLQLQLDGMFGHQVYNPVLVARDQPSGRANSTTRALDRWTPANVTTAVPRAGVGFGQFGDAALEPGGSFRLSTAQLGYTFGQQAPRQVSLWAAGHNLLVLARYRGYDPNVSSAGADPGQASLDTNYYPVARTVALGITATL